MEKSKVVRKTIFPHLFVAFLESFLRVTFSVLLDHIYKVVCVVSSCAAMCFTYMTYLLKCLIITLPASRQRQILVEQLDAKTAKVEKLVVKDFAVNAGGKFHVETSNADLAYYMKLKEADQYDDLQEGDIVGFYEDEESGETYIQQLRSNNIHNALHAGVISRSHWLAGHKPLAAGTYTYLKFLFLIRVYDGESGYMLHGFTVDIGEVHI